MNHNPQSPTKLTEFAPLSPEDSQSGVGLYISKFFTFGKSKQQVESQSSVQTSTQDASSSEETPRELISTWDSMDRMGEHSFPVDIAEGRSLPNVLKRISNLLALKRSGLQSYKDTDFKQYWMPDSVSKECYECAEKFTTFRRRHHCRVCGQIFCSRCCNQEIPGKIMGCTGDLRVCTYCCKVVLSYLQSADTAADLSADLRLVQEDLQTKFGNTSTLSKVSNKLNSSGTNLSDHQEVASVRRKTSVGFQEDCFALGRAQECGLLSVEEPVQGLQTLASIRSLLEDIFNPNTGITLQTHRHHLRNCHDCFIGSELVDWLISQGRVTSRLQGTAIGQALLERGFLESVSEQEFVDGYALYFPLKQSKKQWQHEQQLGECQEPLWVKQIPQQDSTTTTDSESDCPTYGQDEFSNLPSSGSTFYLNMNVEENTVSLSRPKDNSDDLHVKQQLKLGDGSKCSDDACTELRDEFLSGTLWLQQVEANKASERKQEENEEEEIKTKLGNAYRQLELNLLKQLLNYEALSQSWVDIVLPLVTRIIETVKPNVKSDSDDMDIRQYVQFKKVAGGSRQESCIVNGVVCTKNIAHRAMSSKLSNPRILLLGCSIVYQRIEGRLLSLEPVLMQEHEYLRNVVARIVALQPNVVLVQKGVSRLAQDLLLNQGITLALNVRTSVLERVSRCTQADIVSSVDAHIGRPRLGTCSSFYVKTFQQEAGVSKTLMFFEGCAFPHLGCTVLLRGASVTDLHRLKRVMNLMIFVRYSWSLEKAFLIDEFACPPDPPKDSFFDEIQSSPADCGFPSYSEGLDIKSHHKSVDDVEDRSKLSAEQDTMEKLEKILNAARSLRFSSESGGEALGCVTCGNLSSDLKTEEYNVNAVESDLSSENRQLILEDSMCNSQQYLKDKSPSDEKKINVESVSDFSDPLHSYLNLEDDVFNAEPHNGALLSVEEVPASNKFRKALDDIILSGSPFLKFSVPYLETEAGRNCVLRKFFPPDIFWSGQFEESSMNTHSRTSSAVHITQIVQDYDNKDIKILPKHPFTSAKLTSPVNSKEVQALLANFRACGGRLLKSQTQPNVAAPPAQQAALQMPVDALHPTNHQHLAVMFCSYAHESNNAPAFCVNPWVVKMDFYGRNDIPLGEFLERYCFRSTYLCPSEGCDVPMLGHVRRFVHDGGCVHILLKGLDQPLPGENDTIRMWSWCSVCNTTSPIVYMSSGSWSFSFAKFLELRFHGFAYTRRQDSCTHSLHQDHYLYFGLGSVVASFKYTSIMLWEISLPPPMIHISYDSVQQVNVIEEIKKLALKGYDVYSNILERLCVISSDTDVCSLKQQLQREQVHYKSCIEEIQLKLTSPTLEAKKLAGKMAERDVQQLMWHIDDSVVQLKRLISDVVTTWNTRLQELIVSTRRTKKNTVTNSSNLSLDVDEVTVTQEVGVEPDLSPPTPSSEKREDELSSPTVTLPMISQDSEETCPINETIIHPVDVIDESSPRIQVRMSHDFSDDGHDGKPTQKSVKNILSQLLPSVGAAAPIQSPLSPQEHHLGPPETSIPVVVYESEPSSIIAYALSSQDYRRGFEEMRGEQTVSSIGSHKGQLDGVQYSTISAITDHTEIQDDPSPSSKPNKSQPSQHIEVQFADSNSNFYCRCYFVEQFANLRTLVLPAGEEGFVRSLARCIQWAARGGKSGSSFCKTKDDRFILKEMSKLEMQLFLDFAPHYFSYISRCLSLGQPTLLGKIVGVYRVVFRNSSTNAALRSNLLVMENLFYARQVTHKFDLKGSNRNRLVNPNSDQDGEIVLLDENLLKMTCDSPLYIHPHSKTVLMQAINSDTQFLSSQSVMDYSLLVGLDKDKNELVVGIIDYIRTFTWDKKLETMVKSSGILGGQGKLPTVVSPVLYRARFIAAMHRYFLPVPDRWTGLGKGLDC